MNEFSYEEVKILALEDREALKHYEVIPSEEFKTGKPRRLSSKNCFEKAFKYVVSKDNIEGIKLVHGFYSIKEYTGFHAWVELPGNIIFDGVLQRFYEKEGYYSYYKIIKIAEYSSQEMQKKGKEAGGHFGPWR